MKVLVVGSGGRDHTITWKLSMSPRVKKLYVAPGNAGMAFLAERVNIKDPLELAQFAKEKEIDLTIVGPEQPLSQGIVDMFEEKSLRIVGPSKAATILESSKAFTKRLASKMGVPVAEYEVFDDPDKAREYIERKSREEPEYQFVVKADGLAAGKGSLVCDTEEDAFNAIKTIMEEKKFGDSGNLVVIEKRLYGRELYYFCLTDGETVLPQATARDYKRAFDFDMGTNTGGMGAYSPNPNVTPELEQKIMNKIVVPLIEGLRLRGIVYKGFFYAGLMLVEEGGETEPYMLEINVRQGDPEAQVILPRLRNDFLELCEAILEGRLHQFQLEWDPTYYCCVCAVSGRVEDKKSGVYPGYPDRYKPYRRISGLESISNGCLVFHAGTEVNQDGSLVTIGGRVLNIVGKGKTLREARSMAYDEIKKVSFEGVRYRTDIGLD